MKILQVIPYFCFGGAEIMCENLTYALRKRGHEVSVVSLFAERTPISQRMEEAGVKIRYLDKKMGLDLSMVPKLRKIMEEEQPDVVHTHLDVIKYAALAAKLAGVKACVHTVHSVAHKEAEGKLQKIINKTYYHLGLSRCVALSPEVQDTIADFYRLEKAAVPVIFNGVDLGRCLPKTGYEVREDVNLLHVGRFDHPKNHAGLLRAFRLLRQSHPRAKLHLVGDGELRQDMVNLARELDLTEAVTFYGMQSDVYPFLHEADVFVLPSLYEGIPMTIIEAMGTGLPIVASQVGGIPDLLENEVSGMLCDCGEEAIAAALDRVIRNRELRERLGLRAKQESQRFSAAYMAEQYEMVYEMERL